MRCVYMHLEFSYRLPMFAKSKRWTVIAPSLCLLVYTLQYAKRISQWLQSISQHSMQGIFLQNSVLYDSFSKWWHLGTPEGKTHNNNSRLTPSRHDTYKHTITTWNCVEKFWHLSQQNKNKMEQIPLLSITCHSTNIQTTVMNYWW